MQTIPRSNTIVSGCIQTPLLIDDQLEVGVFLAGATMQNIWRVEEYEPEGGVILIRKQPEAPHAPGHRHAFTTHQNTTCECGTRRQTVRGEVTGLLPLRANTPRVYLIKPIEPLVMPDKFTVYLTSTGEIVKAGDVWSRLLPLIPALYPVWTLPVELRSRLR